jgi:hypothetical protein
MSDQREEPAHEPNSAGFGGDASTPEPTHSTDDDLSEGERIAVPDTDLVAPIGDALQGAQNDRGEDS